MTCYETIAKSNAVKIHHGKLKPTATHSLHSSLPNEMSEKKKKNDTKNSNFSDMLWSMLKNNKFIHIQHKCVQISSIHRMSMLAACAARNLTNGDRDTMTHSTLSLQHACLWT